MDTGRGRILGGDLLASLGVALLAALAVAAPRAALQRPVYPDLREHLSGFEDTEQGRNPHEFQWTRLSGASVRLPVSLWGAGRVGVRVSSPAGPRQLTLTLPGCAPASAMVAGAGPVIVSTSCGPGLHPLDLSLTTTALDERRRGLRVHEVTVEGERFLPRPAAIVILAAAVLLMAALLRQASFAPGVARLLAGAITGVPAVAGLALSPFACAHVVLLLGPWLPVVGLVVVGVLRAIGWRWPALVPPALSRVVVFCALLAAAWRGSVFFHPAHHYKDEVTQTRITSLVLERGVVDVWTNIEDYQREYELGTTFVPGGLSVVRYPAVFYTAAAAPAAIQGAITGEPDVALWNRRVALLFSVLSLLPVLLVAGVLARDSRALWGTGLLLALCPSDLYELVLLSYGAITGKVADLAFVAVGILTAEALGLAPVACVAGTLALALLVYPAAWVNLGLFMILLLGAEAARGAWRSAAALAAGGLLAALVAQGAFYHGLLGAVFLHHIPAGLGDQPAGPGLGLAFHPEAWFWPKAAGYYSGLHVLAAAGGLALLLRQLAPGRRRSWVLAWVMLLPVILLLESLAGQLLQYFRGLFLTAPLLAFLPAVLAARLLADDRPAARRAGQGLLAVLATIVALKIVTLQPGFFLDYHGRLQAPPSFWGAD